MKKLQIICWYSLVVTHSIESQKIRMMSNNKKMSLNTNLDIRVSCLESCNKKLGQRLKSTVNRSVGRIQTI